jgi:hypothetical protein
MTTSIAEGFGLAFLESWLMGRSLAGRNLPEITSDFSEAGVDLTPLYDRLDIPLEWVGEQALRAHLEKSLGEYLQSYNRPMGRGDLDRAYRAMVSEDLVEFGRLDEPLQEGVI